jgi:tRNA-dihydrouridine synthase B
LGDVERIRQAWRNRKTKLLSIYSKEKNMTAIFTQLGLSEFPLLVAPLAGVSDAPFRMMCTRIGGADLSYVEMLSAVALLYKNPRTWDMLKLHPLEDKVGVQVTGRSADEVARAVEILGQQPFVTIDINMGCPVRKVVNSGCGSAILKDPQRVYDTVYRCKQVTDKPLSAKIRLGWDEQSLNFLEVGQALQEAGADWVTVHGRRRNSTYQDPVDLEKIGLLKRSLRIPVLGNGNLFTQEDGRLMREATRVDGGMVSRGALGNPWAFQAMRQTTPFHLTLDAWHQGVLQHLTWQFEIYGDQPKSSICMRKHMLWYMKGWPDAKRMRERSNEATSIQEMQDLVNEYYFFLRAEGVEQRFERDPDGVNTERFTWKPVLDRTVDEDVFFEEFTYRSLPENVL